MAELEGAELIKAVAERVMGWFDAEANPGRLEQPFFVAHSDAGLGVSGRSGLWNPLTSMSDAWDIVREMQAKGYIYALEELYEKYHDEYGHYEVSFTDINTKETHANGATEGEAIARAALAAMKEAGDDTR